MGTGETLRNLAVPGKPGQVVGVINACCAKLAAQNGLPALYLSGGATAASLGLPDLGVLNAADFAEEIRKITAVSDLPLLVDADTGFGNELAVARTTRLYERSGAAGLHIEDQVGAKRCGHRPGKTLCPAEEMCSRIKAACDARTAADFVVMARTDALAIEGFAAALERAQRYVEAGADMIFLEAVLEPDNYGAAAAELSVPLLANLTEFGVTPLLELQEIAQQNVALALYPLSAFRAMMRAAEHTYAALREQGSQKSVINHMQTREELYALLGYHQLENSVNAKH